MGVRAAEAEAVARERGKREGAERAARRVGEASPGVSQVERA